MPMGFVDKTQPDTRSLAKNCSTPKSSIDTHETKTLDDSTEADTIASSQSNHRSVGKRPRPLSFGDESFENNTSGSLSPEIDYAGTPATFKIHEKGGRVFIVKVPMSFKPKIGRSQKCTDRDISDLLDSDDEDLSMFDPVVELGKRTVGTPQNSAKYIELRQTPERTRRRSSSVRSKDNSPDGTDSKSEAGRDEKAPLRIKLRRSTEQSNYKIAVNNDEDKPRRTSSRSCVGTPRRCKLGDCNDDHDVPPRNRESSGKTPKRRNVLKDKPAATPSPGRTRGNSRPSECGSDGTEFKSLRNKENVSKSNNDNDRENETTDSNVRTTRSKSRSATPQKSSQNSSRDNVTETPRKIVKKSDERTTPRRRYLDAADIINVLDRNEETVGSRLRGDERDAGTPRKPIRGRSNDDIHPSTPSSGRPRRNSTYRRYDNETFLSDDDNAEDDAHRPVTRRSASTRQTPQATPQKQRKIIEEPTTPETRQTPRNSEETETPKRKSRTSVSQKSEQLETPRKTTRKCVAEKMEEIGTPKRTPRKSVAEKIQEIETPKRRSRRPATIPEVDEPITPTAGRKIIVKSATPSIRHGNLTPSMSRRTANVGRPKTILEQARAQLHVSTVPKSLPCRDDEFNNIFTFLESKLLDNSSGCIYVSGVPGTGKTATVTEAIRALKRCVAKGQLEDFDFIEINGMKLSEPRQAYVRILKQITGQTATWEQAHGILDKRFTKSNAKRQMTLLLVDELDLLCNKRQDVVYNLLDWPSKQNAHLVVITIANTMDLPERILMSRVTSRLGLTRITFQPYTFKQLQEIVEARLKDSDAFKSEAIQLVARKVAAVSGDARRALDICRRSTEITEFKAEKMVTMLHVNEALQEMISSAKVKAIKMCSEMEKFFLRAVDAEVTRTGVEEVVFQNIYRQLTTICSFEGIKTPNITLALLICSRLSAYRLLLSEQTRNDLERRIILNVSSDDIHFAMQTFEDC